MLLTVTLAVCDEADADGLARGLLADGLAARVDVVPTRPEASAASGSSPVVLLVYGNVSSDSLVLQRVSETVRTDHPVALTLRAADAGEDFWRWVDERVDVDTPLAID